MLNPVLRKEAQTTLRSWKIYILITAYVGLICLVCGLFIYAQMEASYYRGFDVQSMIYLYALLCGMQLGLILITTPALTAGSISGERERQTLDLLLVTKMSAFSIVLGKLASSIGVIVLMTIATVPVFAIMFYFGGVSLLSLLGMTGFLLVTSFAVGSVSIFLSTIMKSTALSTVIVYIMFGFLCLPIWIIYVFYVQQVINGVNAPANAVPNLFVAYLLLFLSPAAGFFSLIDAQIGTNLMSDFLLSYAYPNSMVQPVPFWLVNIIGNSIVGILFLWLASLRIRAKE